MGLDMYLERRTYVKNWSHMKPEERTEVTIKGNKAKTIKPEKISYITEEVAYWRKANQIHNWFVENCYDDNDREMNVSREQLKELLGTVNTVLDNSKLVKGKVKNGQRATGNGWEDIMEDGEYIEDPSTAKELLPTTEGFFFGGTDYDQYYIEDLKHTKEVLEALINGISDEDDRSDYYYVASW